MSSPRSSWTAPERSETATTLAPWSCSSPAATPPTLPKPWTTQRCSPSRQPSRWQARALPGHPHRERGALAERDLHVVANAALRGAEHRRVLDPVGREDAELSGVEVDGDADDERALRVAQPFGHEVLDVGMRQRLLELRKRGAVERRLPLQLAAPGRNLLHLSHRTESSAGSRLNPSVRRRAKRDAGGGTRTLMRAEAHTWF